MYIDHTVKYVIHTVVHSWMFKHKTKIYYFVERKALTPIN